MLLVKEVGPTMEYLMCGFSLPVYGSLDLSNNEFLEEDTMFMEPGLVFFEVVMQ
jgi:hypothetical protein